MRMIYIRVQSGYGMYVQGPQGEIRRSFRPRLEDAGRHQGRRIHDGGGISGNDIATLQVQKGYYKVLSRRISLPRMAQSDEAEHERATHFTQPIKKRA